MQDVRIPIFDRLDETPTYWYVGNCPHSGELLKLPRTKGIERIARNLMPELAKDSQFDREGKMYGILLVKNHANEHFILKAFSGLLNGETIVSGWVPPLPGRDRVVNAETETLADLEAMQQELIALDKLPERELYRSISAEFSEKLAKLAIIHRQHKEARQQERDRLTSTLSDPALELALAQLEDLSRKDKRERRHLKQERDLILQPLQAILDRADTRIRELKQQRKLRSRQLQTQMHEAYQLMNFLGVSSSLRSLMPAGMPTGTGDCCAPKLLHYAATHQLKPMAMAEFWWGGEGEGARGRRGDEETGGLGDGGTGRKIRGEFYGACVERCQPLMGFMLAGIASPELPLDLPLIYEDEYLIAVDKPTGLLSVPGRSIDLQDSVLTRLQRSYPELYAIHRLDRDTSGILLLARDKLTYQHLSQQFHDRQVSKVYEAILGGIINIDSGSIELPLWGDPIDRPRQKVDFNLGKPSLTEFQVLAQIDGYTRVKLIPHTGRTHQLRVHTADARGLGVAILGDRLYGCQANAERLHLHARELSFIHPDTSERISIQTQCPF